MSYSKILFAAIYGVLLGAIIWQPSYPVAFALFVTAVLYLLTNEEVKDRDPEIQSLINEKNALWDAVHRNTGDIADMRSNVSKLNLGAGLKSLKKEN
jgi:hypothetical protein